VGIDKTLRERALITIGRVATIPLREVCGVRSGDKGDISDLTLFADDEASYLALLDVVTVDAVRAHFGALVRGPIERYEAPNVFAIKFVLHGALGGGGPRSLRSDNLGKTLGAALLRLRVELPDAIVAASPRRGRRAPIV
jgi:hypothetical protein